MQAVLLVRATTANYNPTLTKTHPLDSLIHDRDPLGSPICGMVQIPRSKHETSPRSYPHTTLQAQLHHLELRQSLQSRASGSMHRLQRPASQEATGVVAVKTSSSPSLPWRLHCQALLALPRRKAKLLAWLAALRWSAMPHLLPKHHPRGVAFQAMGRNGVNPSSHYSAASA